MADFKGLDRLKENIPSISANAPTYNQGNTVTDAYNQLNQHNTTKPGEYQSQYQSQIDSLVTDILNRPNFSYDMNADPVYNQYKQQYMQQGNRAMRDTIGQSAMLTGGYGNSYGTTAGNQAYNQYLSQLNTIVPQLQANAQQQYNDKGQQMYQNAGLLQGLEDNAYGKHRDTLGDWRTDRDYYSQLYDTEYNRDYTIFQNQLNQWNSDRDYIAQLGQAEQAQMNRDQEWAYQLAKEAKKGGRGSSAMNAYWKELAAADKSGDLGRYNMLYQQGLDSGFFTTKNATKQLSSRGIVNDPYIAPPKDDKNKKYVNDQAQSTYMDRIAPY